MAKKNKAEKQILQQERSGVFRDRKRRTFYVDPKTKQGYQLLSNKDNFIYIYDGRALFALLPLALTHAFIKMDTTIMAIVSLLIYYGITFYFVGKVLPKFKKTTTLPDEVVVRTRNVDVLRTRQTDSLLKAMMGVLIIIIIVTNAIQMRLVAPLTTAQTIGTSLSTFVAMLVIFDTLSAYFRTRKELKEAKR